MNWLLQCVPYRPAIDMSSSGSSKNNNDASSSTTSTPSWKLPQLKFSLCHLIESGFGKDGDFHHAPSGTTLPFHNVILEFILPLFNKMLTQPGNESTTIHSVKELLSLLSSLEDTSADEISNFWQFIYGRSLLFHSDHSVSKQNDIVEVGFTATNPSPGFWHIYANDMNPFPFIDLSPVVTNPGHADQIWQETGATRPAYGSHSYALASDIPTLKGNNNHRKTQRYILDIMQCHLISPSLKESTNIKSEGIYETHTKNMIVSLSFYNVMKRVLMKRNSSIFSLKNLLENSILRHISSATYRTLQKCLATWWSTLNRSVDFTPLYLRTIEHSPAEENVELIHRSLKFIAEICSYIYRSNADFKDVFMNECFGMIWQKFMVTLLQNHQKKYYQFMFDVIFGKEQLQTIRLSRFISIIGILASDHDNRLSLSGDSGAIDVYTYYNKFSQHIQNQPANFEIKIADSAFSVMVHDYVMVQWNFFDQVIKSGLEESRSRVLELPSDFDVNMLIIILEIIYTHWNTPHSSSVTLAARFEMCSQFWYDNMEFYRLDRQCEKFSLMRNELSTNDFSNIYKLVESDTFREEYNVSSSIFAALCHLACKRISASILQNWAVVTYPPDDTN